MKKTLLSLLAVMTAIFLMLGLTSCGGGEDGDDKNPQECVHVDADDNSLCDKCGEEFTDGEHEHNYTKNTDSEYLASEAGCGKASQYYLSCSDCGVASTETFSHGEISNLHKNSDGKCILCGLEKSSDGLLFSLNSDEKGYTLTGVDPSALTGTNIVIGTYNDLNVTSIAAFAFSECSEITGITIQESVTEIGEGAFVYCSNLETVTLPNTLTSIDDYTFEGCDKLLYNEYDNAHYLGNESNPYLMLMRVKSENITFFEINSNTKFIHSSAFENSHITSLDIPHGIIEIGWGAFYNCSSLTSIEIPDTVTRIGAGAFTYCSSLTSVTIPDSITEIGEKLFYGCNKLQYNEYNNAYYLGNESNPYLLLVEAKSINITSCIIESKTKIIYSSAFNSCSALTNITIPESTIIICNRAFNRCKNLTNIYYSGTEEMWKNINIDEENNEYLLAATIHYNHKAN